MLAEFRLPAPDGWPVWAAIRGMASFIVSKQKQQWIDYDKADIQYIKEGARGT